MSHLRVLVLGLLLASLAFGEGTASSRGESSAPPLSALGPDALDFSTVTPERLQSMRDPFKAPRLNVVIADVPELERLPLEQYELVGVMMGPKRVRAMVRTPERKMYLVSEGTRLGNRSGVVLKVNPTSIKVREKFTTVFGKEEDQDSVIQLYKEEKKK